jgi:hypothetical protein
MAYITYTSDMSAAGNTYTRAVYESRIDLLKWAGVLSLNDAIQGTKRPVALHYRENGFKEYESVADLFKEQVDMQYTEHVKKEDVEEEDDALILEEEEEVKKKKVAVADWKEDAEAYMKSVFEKLRGKQTPYVSTIYPEEFMKFVKKVIIANPTYIRDTFFYTIPTDWHTLPPEFAEACRNVDTPPGYVYTPETATLSTLYSIYTFFKEGVHDCSWGSSIIPMSQQPHSAGDVPAEAPGPKDSMGRSPPSVLSFRGIQWGNTDLLAGEVISAWCKGEKIADDMREFLIKAIVVRFFEKRDNASYGSTEFFNLFLEQPGKAKLPQVFVQWFLAGLQHRHCKEALLALGLQQVRRAEGQRFIGLKLASNIGSSLVCMDNMMAMDECTLAPYDY